MFVNVLYWKGACCKQYLHTSVLHRPFQSSLNSTLFAFVFKLHSFPKKFAILPAQGNRHYLLLSTVYSKSAQFKESVWSWRTLTFHSMDTRSRTSRDWQMDLPSVNFIHLLDLIRNNYEHCLSGTNSFVLV